MDVSIIIVHYNTKELLSDCLSSIYYNTIDVDFEIIIVDNASFDGSEDFIRFRYPHVIWINSGENLGFGRANNLGVKYAKGEYLFFLNSDTIVKNNAVKTFLTYMKNHHEGNIGVIGCMLLDPTGCPNNSFGLFPSPKNELLYLLGKVFNESINVLNRENNVDYITGADMFMRHDLFETMEGFDSNIFMYYEETDLQYRMAKLGLKRLIIEGPEIVHLEGGSFQQKGLSFNRFMMAQKSYNYFVRKHYRGFRYLCFRYSLILIRLTILFTTRWSWKEKMKAYAMVIRGS